MPEGKRMKVSESVQSAVEAHPAIKSCLKLGLINYSAAARWLSEEGLSPKDNEAAIVSALKRYKARLEPESANAQSVMRLLAASTMNLQNDIAIIRLKQGSDWRKLGEQTKVFHVVEGPSVTNVIVDARQLPKDLPDSVIEVKTGLAAINVRSDAAFASTPGALYTLLFPLAFKGINVEESASCFTDKILIVGEKDAPAAFAALTKYIEQARQSQKP